ncbi:MAG TPA: hypothetical protein PK000_03625 [Candidatus Saccharibacteria bacterium]|nr:hypothetical protein [Candidatus Saccharibacteria bacterium]
MKVMKMEMYWDQHKVFLMGILSLFPDVLKAKPIMQNSHWYYFGSKTEDELVQKLYEYERDGYLEFETVPVLVAYYGKEPDFDEAVAPNPQGFMLKSVNVQKITDDLTDYLEKWQENKLSTITAFKPDDYKHQSAKLYHALGVVVSRQSVPHINIEDVYGSTKTNFYDYIPPFWEVVLSPQLVNGQYNILQMGYDLENKGRAFVDIEITNQEFQRELELMSRSAEPISDEDLEEFGYKGLRANRDGRITYNGEEIRMTQQERDVMRVFLRRPEELRPKEVFTDPEANIFSYQRGSKDSNSKLGRLIPEVHKKLRAVIGDKCIYNTPGVGWLLKINT